uniref:Uncharacterized protein n=1 Tax=Cyprinus carpio TaxID=7962 RepID=A0A8C2EAX0_CYPCA
MCSVIDRSWTEDVSLSDSDVSPHWCRMTVSQNATGGYLTNGNGSGSSTSSEPGATVKSLIKSFDTAVPNGPSSSVQMHTSPRSPLSGIPVRTAPAAAVSPIQRHSGIKPLSKTLERKIAFGDFPHNGSCVELKPSSLMRKSPSLESVIKTPLHFNGHPSSFTYNRAHSKLNVERTDPLSALAQEYGGSKRNALLKWCQKKTEGYPVRSTGPDLLSHPVPLSRLSGKFYWLDCLKTTLPKECRVKGIDVLKSEMCNFCTTRVTKQNWKWKVCKSVYCFNMLIPYVIK